jgi:hypothetical protein
MLRVKYWQTTESVYITDFLVIISAYLLFPHTRLLVCHVYECDYRRGLDW